jgi:hypothetical protein
MSFNLAPGIFENYSNVYQSVLLLIKLIVW